MASGAGSPPKRTRSPSFSTLGVFKAIHDELDGIDMSAAEHLRDENEYQGYLQMEVGRLRTLLEKDQVSTVVSAHMHIMVYFFLGFYHNLLPVQ